MHFNNTNARMHIDRPVPVEIIHRKGAESVVITDTTLYDFTRYTILHGVTRRDREDWHRRCQSGDPSALTFDAPRVRLRFATIEDAAEVAAFAATLRP